MEVNKFLNPYHSQPESMKRFIDDAKQRNLRGETDTAISRLARAAESEASRGNQYNAAVLFRETGVILTSSKDPVDKVSRQKFLTESADLFEKAAKSKVNNLKYGDASTLYEESANIHRLINNNESRGEILRNLKLALTFSEEAARYPDMVAELSDRFSLRAANLAIEIVDILRDMRLDFKYIDDDTARRIVTSGNTEDIIHHLKKAADHFKDVGDVAKSGSYIVEAEFERLILSGELPSIRRQ